MQNQGEDPGEQRDDKQEQGARRLIRDKKSVGNRSQHHGRERRYVTAVAAHPCHTGIDNQNRRQHDEKIERIEYHQRIKANCRHKDNTNPYAVQISTARLFIATHASRLRSALRSGPETMNLRPASHNSKFACKLGSGRLFVCISL